MGVIPKEFSRKPKANLAVVWIFLMGDLHQWKILLPCRLGAILDMMDQNVVPISNNFFQASEKQRLMNGATGSITPAGVELFRRPYQRRGIVLV